jgi:vitamin B12 transporter
MTDADGRFRIPRVEAGAYALRVRYIGYAPAVVQTTVGAAEEATVNVALDKSAQELDQVVVTGTILPTELKASPTPVSVVTAADIERQHIRRIDDAFRQLVPGAVAPEVVTQPELTFRSLRGASTLTGLGTIKVYIDGIEATERSVALVDPQSVEHIEVIRGPQAGAIYGSDAIGGVMQIFTKRGDPTLTRPEVTTQAGLGVIESPYTDGALRQEYSASVRGGAPSVSYNIGGGFSRSGDWVPQSDISQPSAFVRLGFAGNGLTLDVTGRYHQDSYDFPLDPRATATGFVAFSKPFNFRFDRREETYGARLTYLATGRWQHTLTAGVDRFGDDFRSTAARFTTPADSLLNVSLRNERKIYVAYNTSVSVGVGRPVSGVVTGGIEHSILTDQLTSTAGARNSRGSIVTAPGFAVTATSDLVTNTGYFAQGQLNVRDQVFLTAGLRAEENSNFGSELGTQVSPRAGLSVVQEIAGLTGKVRVSYGRALLPPTPIQRNPLISAGQQNIPNPLLAPQRQEGVDAGVDLEWGSAVLGITYYHQTARDLIQRVLLNGSSTPQVFQWQNVGRVRNTGWEFEARLRWGPGELTAQYAIANSRIRDLGPNYTGDLRPGDRPLQTPHTTAGATFSVTPLAGTRVSTGLTYVGERTNYDFLAQFRCAAQTGPCRPSQRDYQMVYSSFAHLNLALDQRITPTLAGFVAISNLGNNTADEINNQTPARGRVSVAGLRLVW